MRHYVSLRRNGSLAQVATVWIFLGIVAASAAVLAFAWLQPSTQAPASHRVLSNLGAILWIATASICLFMALVTHFARAGNARTGFFLAGGLFTLWLGLDDFVLLHDEGSPGFGMLGPVTCAALIVLYLVASWRFVATSRVSLLLVAGLALSASMGLDALANGGAAFSVFADGALRFVGIAFWAGFHVSSAAAVAEELVTGRITTVQMFREAPIRRLVSSYN